jgi:hypothetical protein
MALRSLFLREVWMFEVVLARRCSFLRRRLVFLQRPGLPHTALHTDQAEKY